MTTSFNAEKHEYLIDGKRATGVTTIIGVLAKPQLIGWAARMATEYIDAYIHSKNWLTLDVIDWPKLLEEAKNAHRVKKEAAGEHGTDSHALVEEWINQLIRDAKGSPLLSLIRPVEEDPIVKFKEWAIANVERFLFSERQIFNKELFIAGTADFGYVGKEGKRYMADFKTSSGIYGIDYWLQVAAYRMLAEGEGDKPYDGMTVVRMGKDGAFEVKQLYEYETYKEAFLACLTLYRAQASIKDLIVKQ